MASTRHPFHPSPITHHLSPVLSVFALYLSLVPLCARPQDTRQIFESGQHALDSGDLADAEKDFRAVLAAEPDNVGAHGNLAVVHMRRKEWGAALAELRSAERLAPKMPGIRLNIGLVYYRQGDYGRAIQPFGWSAISPNPRRRAISWASAIFSRSATPKRPIPWNRCGRANPRI
jgi:Tfp pilus assembly protein PilF